MVIKSSMYIYIYTVYTYYIYIVPYIKIYTYTYIYIYTTSMYICFTCFTYFPPRCQLPQSPRDQLTGIVHDLLGLGRDMVPYCPKKKRHEINDTEKKQVIYSMYLRNICFGYIDI